ncbi:5-formyltetrahydrofolate cyclo-ligase [Sulfobacillus acidophilus]|uniref:5-formyltetrahydrofolate cyclo-ligase n=1 Tax=Sulfobacillus acidophilus TaxID=53633 RepID=A0ABS3AV99_9FIRM|nr:5-formyltetrahydrofolate cyclo-ligase [Sulfobacillus acidophilus]
MKQSIFSKNDPLNKVVMRVVMKQVMRDMPAKLLSEAGLHAAQMAVPHFAMHLEGLKKYGIGIFASLPDEIDTQPLDDWLIEAKIPRFFPFWQEKLQTMKFRAIPENIKISALKHSLFKVPEILKNTEERLACELRFILVPGLAFDGRKNRLGRGMGCYDRVIASIQALNMVHEKTFSIALDCQILSSIPVDHHDKAVDMIFTPTRSIIN